MPTEKRPTSVTVIGWFWIIFSMMLLLQTVTAGLEFGVFIQRMGADRFYREMPWYFRYIWFILAVCLGGAVAGGVAAVQLLRLKAWARTVLEVFSWLMFLFYLVCGTYAEATILGGKINPDKLYRQLTYAGLVLLMITMFSVPFALVVRFLRKPRIRQVFARSTPADTPPGPPVDPPPGPPA